MKINRASMTPFNLSFQVPMKVGKETLNERCGYYLELELDNGQKSQGELSPLPGLHRESLTEAKKELEGLLPLLTRQTAHVSNFQITRPLFGLYIIDNWNDLFPSVQFALEMAILQLHSGLFPNYLFHLSEVKNNQLYLPHSPIDLQQTHSLKVKVGRQSLEQDREMLKNIISNLKPPIKLRLDGNRQLRAQEFLELIKGLETKWIEYAEEPLLPGEDWEALFKQTQIPLALDESLLEHREKQSFPLGTRAWVVKPQLYGGASRFFQTVEEAQKRNFLVVVSSCFESQIGLNSLKILANFQNHIQQTFHGLGTLRFFKDRS